MLDLNLAFVPTQKKKNISRKKLWQNLKHRSETKNYSRRGSTFMRTRLTAMVLDDVNVVFWDFLV